MVTLRNLITGNIPKRLHVAIMIFTACVTSFMLRVNMSINMLAMVQPQKSHMTSALALSDNTTLSNETMVTVEPLDYGPRYNWTPKEQSMLLGAYFYGYLFTSLPAGLIAERFGPRNVVGYSLLASAVIMALCPLAASIDIWAIIAARFLIGVMAGLPYPAFQTLISKWVPPDEKGKFVSCLSGGSTFGTVITWPIAGLITERFGWIHAFYAPAVFVVVISVIWFILIADSPSDHTKIKPEEKEYIEKSLGDNVSKIKSWPPLLKVFTSLPFWSLLLLHYGNFWGMNFLITAAPKFMNEVLGFKLANAGFLSSLPYLARMLSGFFFGIIGDLIRRKEVISVTATRKSFCLFSHILPGLFLMSLPFISIDPYVCVAIIVSSLGFNGASTITNLQNAQDLAPNYVATLYGVMNFMGTTAGFLSPMLVAFFTQENNTMDEWKYVFMISASMYLISAAIFLVFGSGNVQKWNEPKKKSVTNIECQDIKQL